MIKLYFFKVRPLDSFQFCNYFEDYKYLFDIFISDFSLIRKYKTHIYWVIWKNQHDSCFQ